jgi:hypothetical protein
MQERRQKMLSLRERSFPETVKFALTFVDVIDMTTTFAASRETLESWSHGSSRPSQRVQTLVYAYLWDAVTCLARQAARDLRALASDTASTKAAKIAVESLERFNAGLASEDFDENYRVLNGMWCCLAMERIDADTVQNAARLCEALAELRDQSSCAQAREPHQSRER